MSILKDKVLVARTAIIAMAISGVIAGCLLGRVLALQLANNWLDQNAKLALDQGDAAFTEARGALAVLKQSPYSFCSEAEMAYFRELVFRSEFLKDAGRMRGRKIDCSTTADHPAGAAGQIRQESNRKDGLIAYSNLMPIRDGKLKRAGLQMGTAYVVFDSHLPSASGPFPLHYSINTQDPEGEQQSQLVDGPPELTPQDLTNEGTGRDGQLLFATRCSTLHASCVTASAPVSEALQGELGIIVSCVVLWGLLGTAIGIAFSVIYKRRRDLCEQFQRAVARDKVEVVYQPIVALNTGRIVGAEALARWNDEDDKAISPDVFIKLAEERGFIREVTKKVLRRALNSFSETLRNHPDFRLSFNVSGADLVDTSFLPMLHDVLQNANVNPKSLVVEITERATAENSRVIDTIRELRKMDFGIHIDDFGTGYSNLDRLLYLFADTIKIDKAFTNVIGTEAVTVAIIPQILAMAKSLNLEVVVEGVENARQANYFSFMDQKILVQGFLYGAPVSAEEFLRLLARNWSRPLPSAGQLPEMVARTFGQPSVNIA